MLSIMELSYIHTFHEFPDNVKLELMEVMYSIVTYAGAIPITLVAERKHLLNNFAHFLLKAKEAEIGHKALQERINYCNKRIRGDFF